MSPQTRLLVNKLRVECDQATAQFLRAEYGNDRHRRQIGTQLRHRRAAAYRLPPMPDGRRDPLDPR